MKPETAGSASLSLARRSVPLLPSVFDIPDPRKGLWCILRPLASPERQGWRELTLRLLPRPQVLPLHVAPPFLSSRSRPWDRSSATLAPRASTCRSIMSRHLLSNLTMRPSNVRALGVDHESPSSALRTDPSAFSSKVPCLMGERERQYKFVEGNARKRRRPTRQDERKQDSFPAQRRDPSAALSSPTASTPTRPSCPSQGSSPVSSSTLSLSLSRSRAASSASPSLRLPSSRRQNGGESRLLKTSVAQTRTAKPRAWRTEDGDSRCSHPTDRETSQMRSVRHVSICRV